MTRLTGLANLIQAGAFGGLAWWLAPRWELAAGVAGVGAALQVAAGLALLLAERTAVARLLSGLTLVVAGLLVGSAVQATLHISTRFGEAAVDQGQTALYLILSMAPWLLFFPLWQVFTGKLAGGRAAARAIPPLVLAGILLPVGRGHLADRPVRSWQAQPELEEAAVVAWQRWQGSNGVDLPAGLSGPTTVLLTPWRAGVPGETVTGTGADLGEALEQALGDLEAPVADSSLVVDLARRQWSGGYGPVGRTGGLGPGGGSLPSDTGSSPSVLWRPDRVKYRAALPQWSLPAARLRKGQQPTVFDSVVVTGGQASPLDRAWTAAPALDADEARQAALEGARMLARNQAGSGRYTYVVLGPSGKSKGGYNLPRHAGVTWFLARVADRTGDPEIAAATARGLAFMVSSSTFDGDRAWFADPRRKDGLVWVGTTALAAMAAVQAEHELAGPWGRFLASSVDETGAVRGELDLDTLSFPPQQLNPYGQGQTVLALAMLVRAGHEDLRPALERAARFMDGDYAPGGAGRIVALDEHWTCIASLAVSQVMEEAHGLEVCKGYLRQERHRRPQPDSSLKASAGPAGGLAEAVVAAAYIDPEGPWRQDALDYGQFFLEAAYRPADSPFLMQPEPLIGGFRDRPWQLDVQMDAVQHVGAALLGVEALLSGRAEDGSLP